MQELNNFQPPIKVDAKELDAEDERILKSIRIRMMFESHQII